MQRKGRGGLTARVALGNQRRPTDRCLLRACARGFPRGRVCVHGRGSGRDHVNGNVQSDSLRMEVYFARAVYYAS